MGWWMGRSLHRHEPQGFGKIRCYPILQALGLSRRPMTRIHFVLGSRAYWPESDEVLPEPVSLRYTPTSVRS